MNVKLISDLGEIEVQQNKEKQKFKNLKGVTRFSIVAEMHGARGEVGHAQLFPQKFEPNSYPFEISMKIE